jgi:recombinational DNA repair ATPase RecF
MWLINLTIRNFRGFGASIDQIDLDADLVLFYGPIGHCKTSLTDAIEWLFYGCTKRRLLGEQY